jgi:hypothetical protein
MQANMQLPRCETFRTAAHRGRDYFRPIISLQAAAHRAQEAAQSFICFIAGYFRHSAPHASHAFRHASQTAFDMGPLRATIRAAAAQTSAASRDSASDFTCSFMPAETTDWQCLTHVSQTARQSLHAFAHRDAMSPPAAGRRLWGRGSAFAYSPAKRTGRPAAIPRKPRRFIVLSFPMGCRSRI